MAKINSTLGYCVILFVLILLASELGCVDGRRMKSSKSPPSLQKIKSNMVSLKFQKISSVEVVTSKIGKVDDFRPTTPGHSPGAGHSIHN
ncbi:hypothetical protein SSX86_029860 [Deinandra increscens subsp. villosa]|uniref:Uncharacterized protein n=1 Tax=Deinandra increscens subsp. villosa TaxID=3103831 RepID=A0AAP0CH55_9ASTR